MNWYKKATEEEGTISAIDPKSKKEIGSVRYIKDNDYVLILYIEIIPEFTRIGFGTKLIEDLMKKENIRYQQIDWGILTGRGQLLKHKLDGRFGKAPFPEIHATN